MRRLVLGILWTALLCLSGAASAQEVPLKALGRFDGWRENALIGYGIVTGLAGTGDTRHSDVTRQALRNVLGRLGTVVSNEQINSRNAAIVVVTARLPPSANPGDRIDATVSSIGDARSLAGGTLLMTPLLGPDQRPYALAQGSLTVGGHDFEANYNSRRRNFPTSGVLQSGATVELPVDAQILKANGEITFFLNEASFTTAQRIAGAINRIYGELATARGADEIVIRLTGNLTLPEFIAGIENLPIQPDNVPRIVINERSGVVVAGAGVRISSVMIAQGDLRVSVNSENYASQPDFISGPASNIRSLLVTNSEISVDEGGDDVVATFPNTTVGLLVEGLAKARVSTRRIISVLQAIKAAGALHAEIVVH